MHLRAIQFLLPLVWPRYTGLCCKFLFSSMKLWSFSSQLTCVSKFKVVNVMNCCLSFSISGKLLVAESLNIGFIFGLAEIFCPFLFHFYWFLHFYSALVN